MTFYRRDLGYLGDLDDYPDDDLFRIGLLPLATALVQSVNGSADPWDADYTVRVVAYLERRLSNWRPSDSRRDCAAYAYVRAALDEYDGWLAGRRTL